MDSSIYKSKGVSWFLITYLSLLLMWKTLLALAYADILGFVPLILHFGVIVMLVMEYPLTKLVFLAWVVFFILIAQGIVIIAKLLASANGNLSYITSIRFMFNVVQFLMGWLLLYLGWKFVRD